MDSSKTAELVRACYAAYLARDRKRMESMLHDEFTFSSPYDDRIGRARYFERCWPNNERITDLRVQKVIASGDEGVAIYELDLPSGGKFRNAEVMTFSGGKLKSIEVFFGDAPAGVVKESGDAGR